MAVRFRHRSSRCGLHPCAHAEVRRIISLLGAFVFTVSTGVESHGAPIVLPYTFANGTIADAAEVNADLAALVVQSNDQDLRLSVSESALASHQADPMAHHSPTDSFSGLLDMASDGQIPAEIARASEVFSIVLASAGSGSGLNADLLDGRDASAFLTSTNDYGRPGVSSILYEGAVPLADRYLNDDQAETITVSSSTPTLSVENNGSGHAIHSRTNSSVDEMAALYGESLGLSGNTKGVVGETRSPGSATGSSVGVYGLVRSLTGIGGSTIGVLGRTWSVPVVGADTSVGVFGWADVSSGRTYGVWGETGSSSQWVSGVYGINTSATGETRGVIGVVESTDAGASGVLGVAPNTGPVRGVYGYSHSPSGYAIYSDGNFAVAPGWSKSAIVETSQGAVKLYSQESPENWFEDFGEGLLRNGHSRIELDPLFLETVTIGPQHPMKVFVQLNGDCNGVFVERDETGFAVIELQQGMSSVPFTYRVVARRRGFEGERLESVVLTPLTGSTAASPVEAPPVQRRSRANYQESLAR